MSRKVVSIQARLAQIEELRSSIETHPLCLNFYEDEYYYYVILPYPVENLDGVRSRKSPSRSEALERIYSKLESLWNLEMSTFRMERD